MNTQQQPSGELTALAGTELIRTGLVGMVDRYVASYAEDLPARPWPDDPDGGELRLVVALRDVLTRTNHPDVIAVVAHRLHEPGPNRSRGLVDPADLTCPGCGEPVVAERPGYWVVAWGLPADGFSHRDGSALCLGRDGRPCQPVEEH